MGFRTKTTRRILEVKYDQRAFMENLLAGRKKEMQTATLAVRHRPLVFSSAHYRPMVAATPEQAALPPQTHAAAQKRAMLLPLLLLLVPLPLVKLRISGKVRALT